MKKYILCFILPFLFLTVKAENKSSYTLQWRGVSMLGDSQSNQKILSFEGSTFIDHTYLPYFVVMTDLESLQQVDSVSVINAAYVDLSADEADLIKVFSDKIKTKPQIEISYTTDRKQRKAVVTLLPVVNEQGKYRKLISFGLKYHFQTKTMLRAGKVSGTHQYVPNSVLNSGKWVKISVKESGIYKISYEDLVKWGISNPANARIFGYGGAVLPESFKVQKPDDLPQVAIWKEKGADGIFNSGDYLLFYAQGPVLWQYNSNAQIFNRSINPYSFEGYYFISSDAGVEKTISLQPAVQEQPAADITTFLDYRLHEQESRNLSSTGKDWFGEQFDRNNLSKSFSFSFPNINKGRKATVSLNAAGDGSMNIYVNSVFGKNVTLSNASDYISDKDYSFNPSVDNISVNLQYIPGSGANLNYVVVNAYRNLIMTGDAMFFRDPESIAASRFAKFHLQGQSNLKIWKINDKQNIQQLTSDYNGAEISFTDDISTLNEYVAINPAGNFPTPTFAGEVANQNLHTVNQADLVIITPSEYWLQANNLAKLHQDKDGLSTLVVTTDQVYNEFSSGTPDATAYRWLMKMLYDRAATLAEAPKYLLLFGDGTYDNRSILKENIPYNKLLTYQSRISVGEGQAWSSDDYFGFLDDDEVDVMRSASLDVAIGRLPVSSSQQATDIVNKISTYLENKYKDYWKNLICYIGDDKDAANKDNEGLGVHMYQSNQVATYVETNYQAFQPKRIFYDAFVQEERTNGESYPQAKEMFDKLLNTGVFMVNYTGHGNPTSLSAEKILSDNDVNDMHNKKWPFLFAATCEFGRFDWGKPITAEKLLLKPDAGFIGVISATRVAYSDRNYELHKAFTANLFDADGKPLALGEVLRRAKNSRNTDENKMCYVLLGDPALIPPIPQNKLKVETLISNSNTVKDTIKALSTVTITGYVESFGGEKMNNFNGKLHAVVYDKKIKIKQLLNSGNTPLAGDTTVFTYLDRVNVLFSGTTNVRNGEFTVQFLVPKDIAYNYGGGRINLYAADTTNNLEAQGYYENFIVGGMKSDFVFENQGPTVNMYLNTPRFQNGSSIDANSIFVAKLYDENGINITSSAIGHDLVLTLNNNKNMSYVLNDYYETTDGDYRSGTVTYKLPTLAEGNYTLTFRAWDLLNNSTTETLTFAVSNKAEPELYNFYAYPNPADTHVRFVMEHDQPSSKLNIDISVYNLGGKQIFADKKTIYSEGNTTVYDWDLVDSTGGRLPKGMYLYRISLGSDDRGVLTSKTNKLIVK